MSQQERTHRSSEVGAASGSGVTSSPLADLRKRRIAELGLDADQADRVERDELLDGVTQEESLSIMQRRWMRFKSLKRGYYSFWILIVLYALSFILPLLVNSVPLAVSYEGEMSFPAFEDLASLDLFGTSTPYYPGKMFGLEGVEYTPDFRALDQQWEDEGSDNWILMPIYPWDPLEREETISEVPPHAPSGRHIFGTDDRGRDVFARMAYGFFISMSFSLFVTIVTYIIGAILGGMMGYFGGKFDITFQRFVEIWQSIPFLLVMIIVGSIIARGFFTLVALYAVFAWTGMTYYMRGEFYREKAKDYVSAAVSMGVTDRKIILKHILPNSLTPLISFFPFAVVAGITVLVSLDYLGFGFPPPTASWGQMIDVGLQNFSGNFQNWWLVITPVAAMFLTLLLITFIGEAIREAFDPKKFSRLR